MDEPKINPLDTQIKVTRGKHLATGVSSETYNCLDSNGDLVVLKIIKLPDTKDYKKRQHYINTQLKEFIGDGSKYNLFTWYLERFEDVDNSELS